MEEARNLIEDRVCIAGNIKPVDIMRNRTVEQIAREAKECIRKGYGSKNESVFIIFVF